MFSIADLFGCPKNVPCAVVEGTWTEESFNQLVAILRKTLGDAFYYPPIYYNYWIFRTDNAGTVWGKRLTWNGWYIGGSWEKLEKDLIYEMLPYEERRKERLQRKQAKING